MATFPALLVDRYVIEREIGRGGMATVYLAHDRRHDRQVAIKVLNADLIASSGAERFVREIQIAAQLTHPHILPLLDSGEVGGHPYYVMPYVAGESLRAQMARLGSLPVADAVRIAVAVARALEYAHGAGIVHRDIKPENVLMASGEAMVADFGIARAVSAAAGDRITITGMAIGTPAYMSPEQASGERVIDGRSDLYSLAVMLYEMLAGEPPFTGPTAQAITARKVSSAPPSVRILRPSVPEALDVALQRALAPNPADRQVNAREFADALQAAMLGATDEGAGVNRLGAALRRIRRVAATWRTLAIAGVACSVVLTLWPHGRATSAGGPVRLPMPTGVLPVNDHAPASIVALSPDGQYIAYVTGMGGNGQLWLRRLDGGTPTAVAKAPHALSPFFSPDSKWLAFSEMSRGVMDAELRRLRLSDHTQTVICPAPDLHGATWLPDGRIVLGGMENNEYGLSIVSADGGKPELLQRADTSKGEFFLGYPSALPDGRGVLFTSMGGGGGSPSVFVLELSSGVRTRLVKGGAAIALPEGVLVYADNGVLFASAFDLRSRRLTGAPTQMLTDVLMGLPGEVSLGHYAIGGDGTLAYLAGDDRSFRGSRVWWVDAAAERTVMTEELRWPASLGGGPVTVNGPRWNARKERLLFWAWESTGDTTHIGYPPADAWQYDVRSRTLTRVFPEKNYYWSVWSPDGEWVIGAHEDDSTKATALFRRRSDGLGAAERVTPAIAGHFQQPYDVSRDGTLLFYQATSAAGNAPTADIYVVSLTGNRTPRALFATPALEYAPALSPDGKWLAYAKAEAGQLGQVWVADFPALQHQRRVTFDGGEMPTWSDDGRWLFFETTSNAESQVARVSWDGTRDPPAGRVERVAGSPDVLSRYNSPFGRSYDISPDGRRVLLATGGIGGGRVDTTAVRELTVIVRWRDAALRALRP